MASRNSQGLNALQRKILELLLPLFKVYPLIDKQKIAQTYCSLFHKTLPVKKHGYKGIKHMYDALDVFNEECGKVSISRPKLLELFIRPLLQESPINLEMAFQKLNGFNSTFLCEYCNVSSLYELMEEIHSQQYTTTDMISFTRPTSIHQPCVPTPMVPSQPHPIIATPPHITYSSYILTHPHFLPPNQILPTPLFPSIATMPVKIMSPPMKIVGPSKRPATPTLQPSGETPPPIKKLKPHLPADLVPACVPDTTQRKVLKLLLPFFKLCPLIKKHKISVVYSRLFKKGLSLKKNFGFRDRNNMYAIIDVFVNKGADEIAISRPKLLDFLLGPLLSQPHSNLEADFETLNGFKPEILCEYCDVLSLYELVQEIHSQQANGPLSSIKIPVSTPRSMQQSLLTASANTVTFPMSQQSKQKQPQRLYYIDKKPSRQFLSPSPTRSGVIEVTPLLTEHPIPNTRSLSSNKRHIIRNTEEWSLEAIPPPAKQPEMLEPLLAVNLVPATGYIEETQEPNPRQRRILQSLLPLFKECPMIRKNKIERIYASIFHKKLCVRKKHGYNDVSHMYKVLDIFNEKDNEEIVISHHKLLALVLHPLLQESYSNLEVAFENLNGFKSTVLCEYFDVSSLQELVGKIYSQQNATSQSSTEEIAAPSSISVEPFSVSSTSSDPIFSLQSQQQEFQPLFYIDKYPYPAASTGTEGSLRAWPRRAPVGIDRGQDARKATGLLYKDDKQRKLLERDIITAAAEDVLQIQRKAREKERHKSIVKSPKPTISKQSSSSQYDVNQENPAGSVHSESDSQPLSHSLVSQQVTLPQTGKSHQILKQSTSSTSKEEMTTAKESTEVVPRNKANSNEVSKLKKINPSFVDLKSVDITPLMKSLPIQVDKNLFAQLVPIEDGKSEKLEVGRWGEAFVFNVLEHQRKLPNGVEIKSIKWLNEHTESGLPYDIKVISAHDEIEYYIEVKSTTSVVRTLIPISWKELQFAQQVKKAYLLLRVYGVRRKIEEVKIEWLSDVFNLIESNPSITLYIKL